MDIGWRVLGNIEARNSTAPNSKRREFHVERKCEVYKREASFLGTAGVGDTGSDAWLSSVMSGRGIIGGVTTGGCCSTVEGKLVVMLGEELAGPES